MSRVRCSPCEVVVPVCECCTEELCYCSKNSIELSCAPCICNPRGPYVGAEPPTLVEGWVPDDGYPHLTSSYPNPGPFYESVGTCGWDLNKNLFAYSAITMNTGVVSDEVIFNEVNAKLMRGGPGGVAGVLTENTIFDPYNAQLFFLLRNQSNRIFSSLNQTFKDFIQNIGIKSPTTYNLGNKFLSHLGKAHLIGKRFQYYTDEDVTEMKNSSYELFLNKFVPTLTTNNTANLENIKEYIKDSRKSISPKIRDGHLNQSFNDNTLRKFWKVLPSDTDQRVRVYRTPTVVRWIFNQGPVVTATNTSPSSIMSVKVNDDDTVTVHKLDGTKARAHYINAESLRVYNTSSRPELDPTPRYQMGCECVSGCYPKICSDRDKAYVFEPEDRAMLMHLLASVDSGLKPWVPAEPYISLTISSEFTDEVEFTGTKEWEDFYLLTPHLSGTDTLSSIIPTDGASASSSYLRESKLNYRVRAINWNAATDSIIDEYTRFISGPGNVFYVDHNDPIVGYLNQAYTDNQDVSASMVDLNIDNILGEEEVYPRRIPYHIVIIPTDSKAKWNPFVSKSRITKMADPVDYAYGSPYWVNGYIERTLKMVPSPRKDVLKDSNYLELKSVTEAPFYTANELLKYNLGAEGIENNPLRMVWKARERNDLGPGGLFASSIQGTIRTFEHEQAKEINREKDSIRKVFDILKDFSTYYDLRNNVTYSAGLSPTDIQNHPIYPVAGAGNPPRTLPKFDLWRYLSFYEFNEFLLTFNDEFFSTEPAWGSFRGLEWGSI